MHKLLKQIKQLRSQRERNWQLEDRGLVVPLPDGRHQRIRLERDGTDYVFTAVVIGTQRVTRSNDGWRRLAHLAWQRNAEHELVTFGFDHRDRLVGRVRHPAEHLDPQELELYIDALSRECDRFEYLLTGRDRF